MVIKNPKFQLWTMVDIIWWDHFNFYPWNTWIVVDTKVSDNTRSYQVEFCFMKRKLKVRILENDLKAHEVPKQQIKQIDLGCVNPRNN